MKVHQANASVNGHVPKPLYSKKQLASSADKPPSLPVNWLGIPAYLRRLCQWVGWCYERDDKGKWTKRPYRIIGGKAGALASVSNAKTWGTFADAKKAYLAGGLDGIGFVFAEADDLAGIDLDDCVEPQTGKLSRLAVRILKALSSYAELSPTGTGVKVLVRGGIASAVKTDKLEMYDRGRFFAITGHRLPASPSRVVARHAALKEVWKLAVRLRERGRRPKKAVKPANSACSGRATTAGVGYALADQIDDNELIRRACDSKRNGPAFARLWAGDVGGYKSRSEADAALVNHLIYWTNGDWGRVDRLFRLSGLMREKWLREDYRDRTIKLAQKNRASGKPRSRVASAETPKTQVESGVSGYLGTPNVPDYQPFPVEVLPGVLAPFVTETAAALGGDPAYVAPHVLAVLGGLLGNKYRLRIKSSWLEPPVVWAATVGESGTVKSPAWRAAVSPMLAIEGDLRADFEQQCRQHEQALAEWGKHKDEDPPPEKPLPPTQRRVVMGETTVEKVAVVLQANHGVILVARDELAGWLKGFDQYKNGRGSDVPNWLEMHGAGPVLVDRKGGGPGGTSLFIPQAAVSVCGTIQPGTFASLMSPAFRDSGLMARLLLSMPPRKPRVWTDADVDPHTINAYADLLRQLHGLPAPSGPVAVTMTPEAKALWVDFFNDWNKDLAATRGDMAAALSKLEAYAVRLALLLHVVANVNDPAPSPVSAACMQAGITLTRWFAGEARRVYALIGAGRRQQFDELLLHRLRETGGTATPRMVRDWNRALYPTDAAAESALMQLVQLGLARLEVTAPGPKGGRPSSVFRLNQ
jgi:hypothetical protein